MSLAAYGFYNRLQDDTLKEKNVKGLEQGIEQYCLKDEPFYAEINGEIGLFKAAALARMPVMLKGPTGCGKTRFVQHMAYRLGRPLITIACHEDLTASDLVGRYLLKGGETISRRLRCISTSSVIGQMTAASQAAVGAIPLRMSSPA